MLRKKILSSSYFELKFLGSGLFFWGILCSFFVTNATVDNRYLVPLFNKKPFISDQVCTVGAVKAFFMTAEHSFNQNGGKTGLFGYAEPFKLRELDKALIKSGRTSESLIRTDMQGFLTVGRYSMEGRFEAQGFALDWYTPVSDHWGFGFRSSIIHVNSRMELVRDAAFDSVIAGPGDDRDVFLTKESILNALELDPLVWSVTGLGDSEVYARLFWSHDYAYRCRYIDAGLSLGLILPTGKKRDYNNPASVPLGGDDAWGVFLDATIDAILKYNVRAGVAARFQQRFDTTQTMRFAAGKEPMVFGALVGEVQRDPGFTLALNPYLLLEEIRDGLGMRLGYTLVHHWKDYFCDRRKDRAVLLNTDSAIENSVWGLEHITFGFFYDFAIGKKERYFEPVVSLSIDAPIDGIASKRAFRTYGVSLTVEAIF